MNTVKYSDLKLGYADAKRPNKGFHYAIVDQPFGTRMDVIAWHRTERAASDAVSRRFRAGYGRTAMIEVVDE